VKRRRSKQSGYALLMVFLLAAVVSITLYKEMPRVAFESQRTKEQLLIDRGEQYKRAIQLFYRKNKRFPTTMDELEKFQEIRYLRQKYKDPMTGKDEWRIIHVGPGGQLTDSLVQKQQNPLGSNQNGQNAQNGQNGQNGQQGSGSGFGSAGGSSFGSSGNSSFGSSGGSTFGQSNSGNSQSNPGFGSGFGSQASNGSNTQQPPTQYNANGIPISGADADTGGAPPSGLNMAAARRHSDQMNLATAGQGQSGALNADPNDLNQSQDASQPSDPNPNQNPNQNTAQQYPGQVNPGQPNPGQPGFPPGLPGQPGFPPGQPGQNPNQGNNPNQNAALNAVQNSLFSPRPGGLGGPGAASNFSTGNASTSPGGGVGIAGVATKYKGPAIKIVNERKKYQEWEFVYDMKKDKSLLGAAGVNALNGQNPQQQGQQGSPGFSSFGNNSNQNSTGSSFGGSSTSQSGSQTQTQTQPQQQQQ
jgi:hypothetical protein